MEVDSCDEPVLRGKEVHDPLVMSAMGVGTREWQCMCPAFALLSLSFRGSLFRE